MSASKAGIGENRTQEAYLYLMTKISELPDGLRVALTNRDFIVFDGECVLCSGFFRFMLKHDHAERYSFVIAQSSLGRELYAALDLPTRDFETNLVIVDGLIHQRLDAFAAAMATLGWPWRVLAALRFLPGFMKDSAYHAIARNRYRLFGRYDSCMMPTPEIRDRFLDVPQERAAE